MRAITAASVDSQRFTGTVVELGAPDGVAELTDWVSAIPLEEWPQQSRLADGVLRPAMVNDPDWRGFAEARRLVVADVMKPFVGLHVVNPMLSVVMPGARIEPHADRQPPEWVTRIHVPLLTNSQAWFFVLGANGVLEQKNLKAGVAYMVNIEREHYVVNEGDTPRIHFMFDVEAQVSKP